MTDLESDDLPKEVDDIEDVERITQLSQGLYRIWYGVDYFLAKTNLGDHLEQKEWRAKFAQDEQEAIKELKRYCAHLPEPIGVPSDEELSEGLRMIKRLSELEESEPLRDHLAEGGIGVPAVVRVSRDFSDRLLGFSISREKSLQLLKAWREQPKAPLAHVLVGTYEDRPVNVVKEISLGGGDRDTSLPTGQAQVARLIGHLASKEERLDRIRPYYENRIAEVIGPYVEKIQGKLGLRKQGSANTHES